MRGAKVESGFLGLVVPLIEGVFSPRKLLLLLTALRGTGLCGAGIVLVDLVDARLGRLFEDWLSCTEDAGVEAPLFTESRVEVDLLSVGAVALESELLEASLLSWMRETVFFRRSSLKNGILRC